MTETQTKANAKVVVTHRLFNPIWIYYKPNERARVRSRRTP
jgi:hypothetical protein